MPKNRSIISNVFSTILAIAIIVSAAGLARYWMKNKPVAKKKDHIAKVIPVVKAIALQASNHQIKITAMGNVIAARKINVLSQVRGTVVATHHDFIPGGVIKKGEVLLKINPLEYHLIEQQRLAEVEKAKNDLALEMGKQQVAKKEYALLGADLNIKDQELILRKPQLKLLKAKLQSAEALLELAKVDIEYCTIKAPFNALLEDYFINTGGWQNVGTKLASLIDTQKYWVSISLPVDRLQFLNIPEFNSNKASKAIVHYPIAWGNKTRIAKIKRLKPNIDNKIRMAQLLLEVNDPLSLTAENKHKPKLILGAFVEVVLQANILKNVLAIPRQAIREGHIIWLLTPKNTLKIKNIQAKWKDKQYIYIDANTINNNEKLIISDLASPVDSMQIVANLTPSTNQ